MRLGLPAFAVGVVTLAAMLVGADHSHSHDEPEAVASGAGAPVAADGHAHSHDEEATASGAGAPVAAAAPTDWPRPFDPTQPVDLSGVDGVTPEQELRATALVRHTLEELPAFADVESLDELGYRSIGDARTGYEHYINYSLINDDVILDPTQPESLVFRVDGDERTLVSAMFIVGQRADRRPRARRLRRPADAVARPREPLLARRRRTGRRSPPSPTPTATAPTGTVRAGGDNPMVHVWIAAHECGPFAALEGHGAGQAAAADGARTDQCAHDDGHSHDSEPSAATGGSTAASRGGGAGALRSRAADRPVRHARRHRRAAGVRREPRVARRSATCRSGPTPPTPRPPASTRSATRRPASSTTSSGTGSTTTCGSIPTIPESLVYRVEPDGSRTLVSAMYMLPNSMALDEVPD